MPPRRLNQKALRGALMFAKECYEDLLKDVRSGKFKTYEDAIQYELDLIEKALANLHVDTKGNLVER